MTLRVATVITRMTAGAGGVALRGALGLSADDYEVTFFAGAAGADSPISGRAGRNEEVEVRRGADAVAALADGDLLGDAYKAGMEVVQIPALVPQLSLRNDLAARGTLTRLLAEGRFDVVHTHSAKAGTIGRVAAARSAVPRIVHTFHGFPFHEFQPAWRRAGYVAIERRMSRYTDAFLAVGTAVATEALRLRLATPDRIRAISPAVAPVLPAAGEVRARAREMLDLPMDASVMGNVGRVAYQKAPEHFVEALAAQREDVWGIWIGGGPDLERMRELAERRGVANRMRWLGHRDDVADLLPAFDVFVMPSRYEGLPCALVEAIGAGIPVVASAVNAVPEMISPGQTGLLVVPQQPQQVADAVRYVLDHPEQAQRMTAAARERLDARFTAEHLGEVLVETYRGPSRRPLPRRRRPTPIRRP
jgi:glycosyltransferase involved in cell wall biosynthesis